MADTVFTWGPSNVTTLLTTTIENRRGDIQDAIFNDRPTVKWFRDKKKVREDGGATIVTHLMYAVNSTVGWFQGFETIDTTPQEGFTATQAEWKEIAGSVSVSNREENIQNVGKHAVFNIVNAKMKQLEESVSKTLNDAFYTSSPASKALSSLVTMIDATSTIQNVNSTTNSWWQALVTTGGSFAAQGRSDMLTTWNTLIVRGDGSEPCDVVMTTPTIHAFYEGSLVPQIRYQNVSTGNNTFQNLVFKTAPVMFDNSCNSGVMYFLNSKHLELVVHSSGFKLSDWVKPSNQMAKVAQYGGACELVTNNRRRQAKVTSITA